MPKVTIDTIASGFASNTLLNANFAALAAAIENTLSRDGTAPNTMSANVDMNSNKLINLSAPTNATDAATKAYVDTAVGDTASAQAAAELAADEAAASAIAAQVAENAAENALDAALAVYDDFDDRYLGAKAIEPTLDNDGDALVAGALYFDTVAEAMKLWTGSAWVAAYVSGDGFLVQVNNLSDLTNATAARTNLGLGTIATQDSNNVTITGGSISGVTGVGTITALTGDVTASGSGSVSATIPNNTVTNAKLADMAANAVKVRAAGTSGDPIDLTIGASQLLGRGASGDMRAVDFSEIAPPAADGWLSDPVNKKYTYVDFKGSVVAAFDTISGGSGASVQILAGGSGAFVATGTVSTGYASFGITANAAPAPRDVNTNNLGSSEFTGVLSNLGNAPSDGTNRYTGVIGAAVTFVNSGITNGIYFRHVDNVNSGNWQCVCRSGGVETVINTSVAYAPASPYIRKFRWVANAAGTSIEFFIDGVSMGSIATNIPSGMWLGIGYGIQKAVGTTSRSLVAQLLSSITKWS